MTKVFFKNLSALSLIQVSNTLIPLLLIPYLARIISPEHFAELEFARYFCHFFTVVVNYGFDVTITRTITNKKKNHLFISYLSSQVFYAKFVLLLLSVLVFVLLVHNNERWQEIELLLYSTFAINLGFLLFPQWFFQGMEKLLKISFLNLISKFVMAFLIVLFIREDRNYWVFNALQSLGLILVGVYSFWLMKKYVNFKMVAPSFSTMKKITLQATPVFLSTVLIITPGLIYFLLIEKSGTSQDLVSYSTANKLIVSVQTILFIPFSQAFFPVVSRLVNENKVLFKKNIRNSAFVAGSIGLFIGIFIFIFAELIIKIIFGKDYLSAKTTLQILGFLPMVSIIANVYVFQGLLSLKKDKLFMKLYMIIIVFNLVTCFIFIQNLTSEFVSMIRIAGEVLLLLLGFFYYRKEIKSNYEN